MTATHYRLVDWMEGLGFEVDVYGLTRPCHGGDIDHLTGPVLLARWYAKWLRAPLGVIGRMAPGQASTMQAQQQVCRVLVTMMLAARAALQLRADDAVGPRVPRDAADLPPRGRGDVQLAVRAGKLRPGQAAARRRSARLQVGLRGRSK